MLLSAPAPDLVDLTRLATFQVLRSLGRTGRAIRRSSRHRYHQASKCRVFSQLFHLGQWRQVGL